MNKNKRNHLKLGLLIALSLSILLSVSLIFFNWKTIQLKFKGYGKEECDLLSELNDREIEEYLSYDEVIDIPLWNKNTNDHHYYDYELLKKYIKDDGKVIQIVDTVYNDYYSYLIGNGYDLATIRDLMKKLNMDEFSTLKEEKLSWNDIRPYININGRIIEDTHSYINSNKFPLDAVMSISYPFINSSNKADMEREYSIDDPANTQLLIKKGFYIPDTYIPEKLVVVNIPKANDRKNSMMRKDAADALESMARDAADEGLILAINSAYRSYNEQAEIYKEYFMIYDQVTASSLVSFPGTSEHQLGLSVDLTSQSVIDGQYGFFGDTAEYRWAEENAHKYGYILRYPEDKTHITGTANEPWHFRYVGVELATKLYEENLSLEEYTIQNGFSYPVSLK